MNSLVDSSGIKTVLEFYFGKRIRFTRALLRCRISPDDTNKVVIKVCHLSTTLQWCHNERNGVSNHRLLDCLFNRLFWGRRRQTSNSAPLAFVRGIHRWPMLYVPKGPINNIPSLVQIMVWRRPGDKPLSESMVVRLLTHLCVTRPHWVKICC